MAKITVAGDAVVITSSVSLEDLKTLKKYNPKALTLWGGEDGKEPIFAVDVVDGNGSISEVGIAFGAATRDEGKLATITSVMKGVKGDVKEYVADRFGAAVTRLNELEALIPDAIADVRGKRATLMDSITIAQ